MTSKSPHSIAPLNGFANPDGPFPSGASGRLKILFLTNRSPYPITDGQSRRTYNILKGLSRRHDVYLLSLYESIEEVKPECIKHLREVCAKVEMFPAPNKTLSVAMILRLLRSLFSRDPYTIWRHYSIPYVTRVRKLLDTIPFDVVHCDNHLPGYGYFTGLCRQKYLARRFCF